MIYKNIKQEFDYLLWLRARIKQMYFGISKKVKTDGTTDFALLTRKLNSYKLEFNSVTDELVSLLRNDDLSAQTDNIRKESGALRIRSAYSNWPEENAKSGQATHQGRSYDRSEIKRTQRFSNGNNKRLLFAPHQGEDNQTYRFQPRLKGLYNSDFRR